MYNDPEHTLVLYLGNANGVNYCCVLPCSVLPLSEGLGFFFSFLFFQGSGVSIWTNRQLGPSAAADWDNHTLLRVTISCPTGCMYLQGADEL